MKTLNELQNQVNGMNVENATFSVTVKEDEYENASDANYLESNAYDSLEEAHNVYVKESNQNHFESDSEYREVELVISNEDIFEVLESCTFSIEYTTEAYGKFLISYRPTNNGIEGVSVEKIDSDTKFQVSSQNRFGTKFEVKDTKNEVVLFIYNSMGNISMSDASEFFEMSLR